MRVPSEALLTDLQGVPECAKVRACLQLKGVAFRRTPATAGLVALVRRARPEAELPVLRVGGETLRGARAILEWLEAWAPTPPLRPVESPARGYCGLLEQWADHVLGGLIETVLWRDPVAAAASARGLAAELVPGPLGRVAARWLLGRAGDRLVCPTDDLVPRLSAAVDVIEEALVGRPYLLGEALTVADVAVYVQLGRLDTDVTRAAALPLGGATRAWRARLDAIEALRTAIGS